MLPLLLVLDDLNAAVIVLSLRVIEVHDCVVAPKYLFSLEAAIQLAMLEGDLE